MNKNVKKLTCIFFTVVLFFAAHSIYSAAQQDPPEPGKKILLIHSYHAEYPWAASITAGVRQALAGINMTLTI